jgi:hypothetical protein
MDSDVQHADKNEPPVEGPHATAARGRGNMFALHPACAFFAILTDSMVSAVDFATLGISAPFLWLIAGLATFVVVLKAQQKWAVDDSESAVIKALTVAFLVTLPTPFPAFLTIPSAIAGTVQIFKRR